MNNKLSITFSTVPELLEKVEQIVDFEINQKLIRGSKLDEHGIIYEDFNEFGFAIDIDKCTKEQIVQMKHILTVDTLKDFIEELES